VKIPCRTCGTHDLAGKNAEHMAYMICLHVPRDGWKDAVEKCPEDCRETIKAYLRKRWHQFGGTRGAATTTTG
jgi:hypothetical protein